MVVLLLFSQSNKKGVSCHYLERKRHSFISFKSKNDPEGVKCPTNFLFF